MRIKTRALATCLGAAALAANGSAQSFVINTTDIPQGNPANNSSTENVDFGDVDLDGDWDAVFADGGDNGNDQNRIWINEGGMQAGVVGEFTDATAQRFPTLLDDSRDIEFADIDLDGDLDVYSSNTAQISNQGNRWWVNEGGEQGGTLGFYSDETAARWVGLDSADSSIPTSLLWPIATDPETFIDWSCDCDFGDLDNDGDLDLFHSTYGGAFGGNVPSRVFLNDGGGHFEEFNPSGFKLTTTTLGNGDPGLWAEGTQSNNTTNTDGTFCDVTGSPLDIDLADIDGDLDIDVLHGSRNTDPRMFANRLEENGGEPADLGFRDITQYSFPDGGASGGGNYEQEMGDFDSDGDVDVYGLNWSGFTDVVYENDGTGQMINKVNLPGSGSDDNEGDFMDYDGDGDLDIYVANFSGQDRLYRNQLAQTGMVDYVLTAGVVPGFGATSLDADMADLDNDADYDVIVAEDNFQANTYLENRTQVPDTSPPFFNQLEDVSGHFANATMDAVRVQVYDNAPYYINWYNPTELECSVDGIDLPALPMVSSGGQIFRGELPGNLVGDVVYNARSTDQYGNSAASGSQSYTNGGGTGTQSGTTSPSSVGTPSLTSLSKPLAGMPMYVVADGVAPATSGVLFVSTTFLPSTDLGDGVILSIGGPLVGSPILLTADADGRSIVSAVTDPALSGTTLQLQYFGADGTGGDTWASSNRLSLFFP